MNKIIATLAAPKSKFTTAENQPLSAEGIPPSQHRHSILANKGFTNKDNETDHTRVSGLLKEVTRLQSRIRIILAVGARSFGQDITLSDFKAAGFNFINEENYYDALIVLRKTSFASPITIADIKHVLSSNLMKIADIYFKDSKLKSYANQYEYVYQLTSLTFNNISSTKGVESLTALTYLDLAYNQLTEINLTHNKALTHLDLQGNMLSKIDLTNNTELANLNLQGNKLSNIDLTHNSALTHVDLHGNQLNDIDLTNNIALTHLDLGNNHFVAINLTKNTSLTVLHLAANELCMIDLTHNTALINLQLASNYFNAINLTKNTSLTNLGLYRNNLRRLDLTKNTALVRLCLSNNPMTSVDLTNNTHLIDLYLGAKVHCYGESCLRRDS